MRLIVRISPHFVLCVDGFTIQVSHGRANRVEAKESIDDTAICVKVGRCLPRAQPAELSGKTLHHPSGEEGHLIGRKLLHGRRLPSDEGFL